MFPRAPLPERIGAYSVLRRLPSTGGADRYLGREDGPRGFTRMVELKLAPAEADPEVSSELAHEASVVAKLNHPYISRMYNFLEHEGRLVLVLERVEGTTLARILASARRRKQKLPDEVVFHVAHRLVSAIAHAHGMADEDGQRTPVVHRSISPASIQVGWGGEVRLSGFGLAKIMGRSPDTAVGLVKGTPGYMAPEQLRGERITERTDIYQAGLVIWEMLSGNPPAAAGTPQKSRQAELVMMMSGPELLSVSELRPSVPREIAAVIDAMLEPSVEKRKISAPEVERWLAKTVDVERGKEALRERSVGLRGQEARDSVTGTEPARGNPRRTTTRAGATDSAPSLRRPVRAPAASPEAPAVVEIVGASDPSLVERPSPAPLAPPERRGGPPAPPPRDPARVTLPDAEPEALSPAIPVEGERGASTLITRLPRRGPLVAAAIVGALVVTVVVLSLYSHLTTPAPVAVAVPSASVAPPPPASSEAPPAPPPVASVVAETPALPNLGPQQGALMVKSSAPGLVYMNGAIAGDTDKILVVACGPRFLRVGAPGQVGGRTMWLTPGMSVKVACGVLTEVDATKAITPKKK